MEIQRWGLLLECNLISNNDLFYFFYSLGSEHLDFKSCSCLFLGIFLAFLFKLPEDYFTRQYGSRILQIGIVFLGGSISIGSIYEINSDYFFWISIFVLFSFGAVLVLGRLLGVSKRFSFLIASGTAICGGTAIASVAPVIKAQPHEVTAALTIVFILNAVAVLIFPLAYNFLELSE